MVTWVLPGGGTVVLKGDVGFDSLSWSVMVPPLLPVSVAFGPLVMEMMVPDGDSISKMEGK